jgi:hypothetical protein
VEHTVAIGAYQSYVFGFGLSFFSELRDRKGMVGFNISQSYFSVFLDKRKPANLTP